MFTDSGRNARPILRIFRPHFLKWAIGSKKRQSFGRLPKYYFSVNSQRARLLRSTVTQT